MDVDKRKRSRSDHDGGNPSSNVLKAPRLEYNDHYAGSNQKQGMMSLRFSHDDYSVGWICALHLEMAAAEAMLDHTHDSLPTNPNDSNTYILGSLGQHNIVIACLPKDGYGTNNAATVASNMRWSFSHLHVRLMVGIGGGVPSTVDIRLGDVVVSNKVVQYDLGKTIQNGRFQRTGNSYTPPQALMTAVATLQAKHELEPSKIPSILSEMLQRYPSMSDYSHQGLSHDMLFDSGYDHAEMMENCKYCDQAKQPPRSVRSTRDPKIHHGVIASANQVMKHGRTRDRLAQELDILCFEMEAAGLMDNFPCLVIRGICDYADSHKNKQWQNYAAATAAAYAKELLSVIPPKQIQRLSTCVVPFPAHQGLVQDRTDSLLASLRFDQIDSRQSNIKAAYSKTCKWLLAHHDYVTWQDPNKFDQHRGFLWINGKAGAGKSTLMNFIYTRVKKQSTDHAATLAFFFNARGDDLEKSTSGMYRSLLIQLLKKMPDLQVVLDDPDLVTDNQNGGFSWGIENLRGLFTNAVAKVGRRRLTCFIDALDECDEHDIREMVECFEDLGERAVQTETELYICFASRPYPLIDIRCGRKLTLEDQIGHGEDLQRYVQSKLRIGADRFTEEITNQVLQKAAGIFMWTVLVVEILNDEFRRGRIFHVKKRLEEIPSQLNELFKDILRRDNKNMADLLLCLQWILYAKRPLKPEEFYFALVSGLEPEALSEWNPEQVTSDILSRFVLSSSKGLAEITKSKDPKIQFIHESVRDFLIKGNGLQDLFSQLGADYGNSSHDQLKQCCQSYMKFVTCRVDTNRKLPKASSDEAKELQQEVSKKFPFLEYSTRYVLCHADFAAPTLPQNDILQNFALQDWIFLNNLFEKFEIRRYTSSATLLYILADRDLAKLIWQTQPHHPSHNIRGERHQYPLFAALANGHQNTVSALLREHASHPQENSIAARLGYGQAFKGRKDHSPLSWAAENGYQEIVSQLLAVEGVDVNSKVKGWETALSRAARNGHQEIAQQLLAVDGVDVNSKDQEGETALSRAAGNGHKEIVQQLLAVDGVDVNSKGRREETALLRAARDGHLEIVQQLLAVDGVDVNSKDSGT